MNLQYTRGTERQHLHTKVFRIAFRIRNRHIVNVNIIISLLNWGVDRGGATQHDGTVRYVIYFNSELQKLRERIILRIYLK